MFTSFSIRVTVIVILSLVLAACNSRDQGIDPVNQTQAPELSEAAESNSEGNAVSVEARDFEFMIESPIIRAGTITFEVINRGTMPHDFAIQVAGERIKTPMLDPGERHSLTVELGAGTYDYLCTVLGHDILGMKGRLTVQ